MQQLIHFGAVLNLVIGQRRFSCFDAADQRQKCLAQYEAVPLADLRLHTVGVAALLVGMVADMAWIVGFNEAERTVIQCQPDDRHIIGVHHAMYEADSLPMRYQIRGPTGYLGQQRLVGISGVLQFRVKTGNHVVGQDFQLLRPIVVIPVFKRSEAHKTGRHAGQYGYGFRSLAHHQLIGADQRQRTRSRDAKRRHRLRAQVFPD